MKGSVFRRVISYVLQRAAVDPSRTWRCPSHPCPEVGSSNGGVLSARCGIKPLELAAHVQELV